jgi:hypothetical protein
MENSFKSVIEGSKSTLILLPTKPRFDQVAAALSLYLSLGATKDVKIFSPTPMTVEFNRLIGVNRINKEIGNKNLVIRFTDYRANDIERVSYDIEDSQFRLTVIPKENINPPKEDQIELAYSGVIADTVIIVGGSNESHFPAISSKDLAGANIVHIGIKEITLSSGKGYISFSRPAPSVSEIVFSLIAESGFAVDPDVATNLLMGIEDSSKGFSSQQVTSETFAIVSELMRVGGKRLPPTPDQSDLPPGSIPGQKVKSGAQQVQKQPARKRQQINFKKDAGQDKTEGLVGDPPQDWLEPKIYKGGNKPSTQKPAGGNNQGETSGGIPTN